MKAGKCEQAMETEEKLFNALKGILVALTILIVLMLPAATANVLQKNIECISQGYQGFAEEQNNITYCYKTAEPTDPLYIDHLKALGVNVPVYVYSIDGELKVGYYE